MTCKNLYALLDDDERRYDGVGRSRRKMKKKNAVAAEEDSCRYGYLLKNHFLIQ
eukprot:CAMPEP_0183737464 /NCGR_PEP_ID=MMETSP0737-20130205/52101_1 /TAXON_ID=385413 /ORGANISM="Thalassiosira miniscula, Strain CCMP1093" /LENGTH=53 /DNA_ID=CAMNT_0025971751 /DNA_START=447 /DNA_END=608 /DNA_ORIENTATION=-